MWKTAIKLILLYIVRNKFNNAKSQLKGDFMKIKDNIADLAENRAGLFKQSLEHELSRLVHSLMGFMLMLVAITCSCITAIIWLTATALESPHRTLIFSATMLTPLVIGLGIYFYIRMCWQKQPLFYGMMKQLNHDWQLFRNNAETSPADDETNLTTANT